jgi:hypothetical protein
VKGHRSIRPISPEARPISLEAVEQSALRRLHSLELGGMKNLMSLGCPRLLPLYESIDVVDKYRVLDDQISVFSLETHHLSNRPMSLEVERRPGALA